MAATTAHASEAAKTIIVGISGPSCSGKTTLARLLRDILKPQVFILHEDDFYKTDADIPIITTASGRQLQDWDCFESLDVRKLEDMVRHVKGHGSIKAGFESMEDQNAVGDVSVDMAIVHDWGKRLRAALHGVGKDTRTAIIDGFLLYSQDMAPVRDLLDVKLLLRASYALVKRRREARKGYVTLEGFWEDPEGYVDDVVWPNYVKDHGFLFDKGDVEGEVDERVSKELGVQVLDRRLAEKGDLTSIFEWVASVLLEALKSLSTTKA